MRRSAIAIFLGGAVACGGSAPRHAGPAPARVAAGELRAPADFDSISDRAARSRALFVEAGRVLTHPRCINCHPAGDVPQQGMSGALHDPPVVRGPEDRGVPGNGCSTCHQDKNQPLARVPGAPGWHLAPIEMAWVGRSIGAICARVLPPLRRGSFSCAQIADHTAHDALVGWGWAPGSGREAAPGSQRAFGALVQAWIDTGAECPKEGGT